jgi:acetyltransferase-like isoleucine patch superfamily enzyme
MSAAHRFLASSDSPIARGARDLHRGAQAFTLPAPRAITMPVRWAFVAAREIYWHAKRLLVCEPIFKSYCKQHGAGVRTGPFVHYVMGHGDIILGDSVVLDGLSVITFAARFSDNPTLRIGDGTAVSHQCQLTVGKAITIGRSCRIGPRVWMFDSNGHPSDPAARLQGLPPPADQVRPITIGDNVWIGGGSIVCPGVVIGDEAVVSAGSVVVSDVPPRTIVSGNPARMVALTSSFRAPAPPPPGGR